MALTQKDVEQLKLILNAALADMAGEMKAIHQRIDGLEKLFLEKLNGHGDNVGRLSTDVDKLGTMQRTTEDDVVALTMRVVQLEGTVNKNAAVAAVQDQGQERKDAAVEAVKTGITAAHLVWVSAGVGLFGALAAALLTWLLTGGK